MLVVVPIEPSESIEAFVAADAATADRLRALAGR